MSSRNYHAGYMTKKRPAAGSANLHLRLHSHPFSLASTFCQSFKPSSSMSKGSQGGAFSPGVGLLARGFFVPAFHRSQPNSFNLVLREPLLRSVVKLGRSRAFMPGHGLRVLQRATVGEIG